MDYIAPLNRPATVEEPRPAYFDGDAQTGQEGSYPSGTALEYPMREILAVIENAGITPSNGDLTQLLQAINALIATAGGGSGGGGTLDFSHNPVFPLVTVNGGLMSITAGTGSVAVAAGQTFVHRGGTVYNSTDTDAGDRTFTTAASKTYHLRWRYNAGSPAFGLFDLADAGYNPTSAAETNAGFDTMYDDMLIARVATNGSNVPTVTALYNRPRLSVTDILTGSDGKLVGANGANFSIQKTLNWSRSPDTYALARARTIYGTDDADFNIFAVGLPRTPAASVNANPPSIPITRYGLACIVESDGAQEIAMQLTCEA